MRRRPGRRGHWRGSPISCPHLGLARGGGQVLDRGARGVALRWGEEVAPSDAAQFAAQPHQRPAAGNRVGVAGNDGFGCHRVVLGRDRGGHPADKRRPGGGVERAAEPDRRVPAVVGDFFGDPFQLLAGPGVGRQSHQPITQLGDAEPFEFAPHRRTGRGRHAGQPVEQQHPVLGRAHGHHLRPAAARIPQASLTGRPPRLHFCDHGRRITGCKFRRLFGRRLGGGDLVRTGRPGLSRDARLLVAGQGARAAGYGFTAVLLGALLAARGYTPVQVGVVLTALIAGTALASLAVGAYADRLGRRRCYAVFFAGIAAAGVVVASGAPLWVLLSVALTGTLSTDVVDNGPATTLEQAMLAAEDAGTATVYGRYNAVGSAAGALGSLAVILPGLGPRGSGGVHVWLFLVLVPVGISGMILAGCLSPAV